MLQAMRSFAKSFVMKAVFIVLVVSFAGWGISDIFTRSGGEPVLAKVGDHKITLNQAERSLSTQLRQLRPMFGGDLTRAMAEHMGLPAQALDMEIDRAVFNALTTSLSLHLSDKTILRYVEAQLASRMTGGRFDRFEFARMLQENQLTEHAFFNQQQMEMGRSLLLNALAPSLPAPASLRQSFQKAIATSHTFEVITLESADFNVAPPTNEALEAYLKAHQNKFMSAPERTVDVLSISKADIKKHVPAPDADTLRDLYKNWVSDTERETKATLRQLIFNEKDKAEEALALAMQKGDISAVGRLAGMEPSTIEDTNVAELPTAIAEALKNAKGAKILPIVQTDIGWHVMEVLALHQPAIKSFDEKKAELIEKAQQSALEEQALTLQNSVEDALAAGNDYKDIAAQLGLSYQRLDHITTKSTLPATLTPTDSAAFLNAVTALSEGEETGVQTTPDGGLWVAKVASLTPAKPQELAERRADVLAAFKLDGQNQQRQQAAGALLAAWQHTPNARDVLTQNNAARLHIIKDASLLDQKNVDKWPQALRDSAFKLDENGITRHDDAGVTTLVKLTARQTPRTAPALKAEDQAAIDKDLSRALADDRLKAIGTWQRSQTPVTRNPVEISRFLGQSQLP